MFSAKTLASRRSIHTSIFFFIPIVALLALASGSAVAAKGGNPPTIEDQSFILAENQPAGSEVGQVVATSDKKNDTLEFQIVAGNDTGLFQIDLLTGSLTTTAPLDHEATPAHLLTVEVTNRFGRASSATVTVNVADVNEPPTAANATFAVSELAPVGTVVGTIVASDPDSDPLFGTLAYSIIATQPSGVQFVIDSDTGVLKTNEPLDFESNPQHVITVGVTDGGGLTDTATVTVSVTDGNEPPTATDSSFTVSELLPVGSTVGTVSASDPDTSAPFNTLSFAISGGNTANTFGIDATTGDIITLTGLDFDTSPLFNLTVEVTDGGGQSDSANVTINVVDAVVPSDVSEIDGTNGFALTGSGSGSPVTMVGDVNGDGIDDFAVSAPGSEVAGQPSVGSVYVVFGAAGVSPAQFDLSSLDGSNGFRFDGADAQEFAGEFISGAGDINNDGLADILISAIQAVNESNNSLGAVYVVFGGHQFAPVLSPADLDGATGFRIINNPLVSWGFIASAVGDLNGDGIDDFGIGSPNESFDGSNPQTGQIYGIFGRDIPNGAAGFGSELNLADLDASTGMLLYGVSGDFVGSLFGPTGDLNGDGFDDFIASAPEGGHTYVVFGNLDLGPLDPANPPTPFNLATLDGLNGFVIDSGLGNGLLGGIGGGDVNGDGYADALIAAPGADRISGEKDVGALYVIFGGPNIDWANFDLTSLDGSNGFRILGAADADVLGFPSDNRSDIDGDGFADTVIGTHVALVGSPAPGAPPPQPILYYLIAGSDQPFPATIDLQSLDPSVGSTFQADFQSDSMSAGGDVNGDGHGDFLIGSGQTEPAHVVFGGAF